MPDDRDVSGNIRGFDGAGLGDERSPPRGTETDGGRSSETEPTAGIGIKDLLAEIHRLGDGDDPPTAAEMNERGDYHTSTYQRRFGSWNDAVEAAGFDPRDPPSDAELVAEIHRLATDEQPPTEEEMNERGEFYNMTYVRRFGSWNGAVETAGFNPRESGPIPEEKLLAEIDRLAEDGDPPSAAEMNERGDYHRATFAARFDSWNAAVAEAGYEPNDPPPEAAPKEDLLAEIDRLAEDGDPPSAAEMNDRGAFHSTTLVERFGSWNAAVAEAGYEPEERGLPPTPEEELLAEIDRLTENDEPPTAAEMNERGVFHVSTYRRRFGSWADAVETAGYEPRG